MSRKHIFCSNILDCGIFVKGCAFNKLLIMMKVKSRTLTLMLTFLMVLFVLVSDNTKFTFSMENHGGELDIFTQKEPFSGRGLNASSDAFGPEEKVVIYASVRYNNYPVAMALVAFEIHGPENSVHNVTFVDSAHTDSSGIANTSFRIGLQSDINFGEWEIIGSVYLADAVLLDFLTFKVGWIVEIVSIRTVDRNYVEQTKFTKGSVVGIELSVQNMAMIEKTATITVSIYDSLNVLVNSTQIYDCELPPNGTILYIHCPLTIPKWASTGYAAVSACAYTAPIYLGGVAYCPRVSKHFLIVHRDIAVLEVETSPMVVYEGETVNIDVTVKNEGCEIESFDLGAFYNNTNLIGARYVANLEIGADAEARFVWNTSRAIEGFYQISAHAEPVPDEIDISDNIYVDGVVHVKARPPPHLVHDVAVLNVTPSSTLVYIGEAVDVCVVVKNQGNYTESFEVAASYDNSNIETKFIENLESNTEKTLVFRWNTQHVQEGNYTLRASASFVPQEVDFENNLCVDGVVEVKAVRPPLIIHDVAVSTVCPYSNLTYIGEVLEIFVIVKNKGNAAESFNVSARARGLYDLHVIETLLVENLEPSDKRTLVFRWNTQDVAEGNYTLSALASQVPGEENLDNNFYEDGIVTVVKAPMRLYVPWWFYWLLLLLLVMALVLLIVWYYYRKRRKRAEEAFYSGWTAWYYGRDMRNKLYESESSI